MRTAWNVFRHEKSAVAGMTGGLPSKAVLGQWSQEYANLSAAEKRRLESEAARQSRIGRSRASIQNAWRGSRSRGWQLDQAAIADDDPGPGDCFHQWRAQARAQLEAQVAHVFQSDDAGRERKNLQKCLRDVFARNAGMAQHLVGLDYGGALFGPFVGQQFIVHERGGGRCETNKKTITSTKHNNKHGKNNRIEHEHGWSEEHGTPNTGGGETGPPLPRPT